jgi:hypothetical protein
MIISRRGNDTIRMANLDPSFATRAFSIHGRAIRNAAIMCSPSKFRGTADILQSYKNEKPK